MPIEEGDEPLAHDLVVVDDEESKWSVGIGHRSEIMRAGNAYRNRGLSLPAWAGSVSHRVPPGSRPATTLDAVVANPNGMACSCILQ